MALVEILVDILDAPDIKGEFKVDVTLEQP